MLRSVCQAESSHHPQDGALSQVREELSLLHHNSASFQIWQRLELVVKYHDIVVK